MNSFLHVAVSAVLWCCTMSYEHLAPFVRGLEAMCMISDQAFKDGLAQLTDEPPA